MDGQCALGKTIGREMKERELAQNSIRFTMIQQSNWLWKREREDHELAE